MQKIGISAISIKANINVENDISKGNGSESLDITQGLINKIHPVHDSYFLYRRKWNDY
ncbi:hypothetical protein ETSB_0950 [cyanobacterium endosymbiont of Epithemia turgida isolate EtSB Lake Yunoko]|nr:hypothetical protein ETSB_0950 [cyanobacterium endosymbiont of Epithemia turgida isolate EtSB Lake Yunoko]